MLKRLRLDDVQQLQRSGRVLAATGRKKQSGIDLRALVDNDEKFPRVASFERSALGFNCHERMLTRVGFDGQELRVAKGRATTDNPAKRAPTDDCMTCLVHG